VNLEKVKEQAEHLLMLIRKEYVVPLQLDLLAKVRQLVVGEITTKINNPLPVTNAWQPWNKDKRRQKFFAFDLFFSDCGKQ
jgi:hypothetical protein